MGHRSSTQESDKIIKELLDKYFTPMMVAVTKNRLKRIKKMDDFFRKENFTEWKDV